MEEGGDYMLRVDITKGEYSWTDTIMVYYEGDGDNNRILEDDSWLFILILLVNMLGWVKVSSDIIMIFAPFFVLACLKEKGQIE